MQHYDVSVSPSLSLSLSLPPVQLSDVFPSSLPQRFPTAHKSETLTGGRILLFCGLLLRRLMHVWIKNADWALWSHSNGTRGAAAQPYIITASVPYASTVTSICMALPGLPVISPHITCSPTVSSQIRGCRLLLSQEHLSVPLQRLSQLHDNTASPSIQTRAVNGTSYKVTGKAPAGRRGIFSAAE